MFRFYAVIYFMFHSCLGWTQWHRYPKHYCDGPIIRTSPISSTSVFTSKVCFQVEPLSLIHGLHSYPKLEALEVDYWKGGFARPTRTVNIYREDVFNCFGDLQRSTILRDETDGRTDFIVDNPNLHDEVSTSYLANAPMTDEEALAALDVARQNCLNKKF